MKILMPMVKSKVKVYDLDISSQIIVKINLRLEFKASLRV
jgi:hypothetical protein